MAVFPSDCGEPMAKFTKMWDQGHCGTKRGYRKLDGAWHDVFFWMQVRQNVKNRKTILFYCQSDHAGKQRAEPQCSCCTVRAWSRSQWRNQPLTGSLVAGEKLTEASEHKL